MLFVVHVVPYIVILLVVRVETTFMVFETYRTERMQTMSVQGYHSDPSPHSLWCT